MSTDLNKDPGPVGGSSPEVRADTADDAHETSTADHGHDTQDTHGGHDAQGGGGHGADTTGAPTLVPTTMSQLILPVIILLVVGILVAGPVINAFSSKPAAAIGDVAPIATQSTGASAATPLESGALASPTAPAIAATQTPQPQPTTPAATPTTGADLTLPVSATQTAVAIAGEQGEVARVPVKLDFGGAAFVVNKGTGLLPDWTSNQDANTATWIEGTVSNHILYIPYNDANQALFKAAKPGDTIKLQMNTGQTFSFEVNRAERALNGPETQEGQFTVSTAMAQDHAGVTLFLTGDPATDRAVVQADFTGNIQ